METLIDELPAVGGTDHPGRGRDLGARHGRRRQLRRRAVHDRDERPGPLAHDRDDGPSSMAEIPTVIVDCQRAGPATGMPSRTEQSDLYHAIYGGPRRLRAPCSACSTSHARDVMFRAFELAENFTSRPCSCCPDACVAQRRQIRDGVTDRREAAPLALDAGGRTGALPITGDQPVNAFRVPRHARRHVPAAGIEHTEDNQSECRPRRAPAHEREALPQARVHRADTRTGSHVRHAKATKGIVAWGSTYGMLRGGSSHPEYRVFMPDPAPLPARGVHGMAQGSDRDLHGRAQLPGTVPPLPWRASPT